MQPSPRVKELFKARRIPLPAQAIIMAESTNLLLDPFEVLGPRRRQPTLDACRLSIYQALRAFILPNGEHKYSLPTIGRYFAKHHTTILYQLNGLYARRRAEKAQTNAP
jgi:hypothetical protein